VPTDLRVDDGFTLFLVGQGQGTQNYICLPSAAGFSWTFLAPQATLFFTFVRPDGVVHQQITTHFHWPYCQPQAMRLNQSLHRGGAAKITSDEGCKLLKLRQSWPACDVTVPLRHYNP